VRGVHHMKQVENNDKSGDVVKTDSVKFELFLQHSSDSQYLENVLAPSNELVICLSYRKENQSKTSST